MQKTKSGVTTRYYYDGSLLLAEKINGQVQKEYINDGQGITGMVNPIYTNGTINHYQRLYCLYDSLGSVSIITGEHGLPLQRYTYSPYGSCLNVHGDPINSLQFIGKYGGYLDSDTGLTYFWHRWYDSSNGRFISRDKTNENNINENISNQNITMADCHKNSSCPSCKKTNIEINADYLKLKYLFEMPNTFSYEENNLFNYTNNNPEIRLDTSGEAWQIGLIGGITLVTAIIKIYECMDWDSKAINRCHKICTATWEGNWTLCQQTPEYKNAIFWCGKSFTYMPPGISPAP